MLYPIELRAQPKSRATYRPLLVKLAERRGFEPPDRFYPINRLAGGCLQPARPPLRTIAGGGSRIRTHGALRLSGFQDRRLQPLGHPSTFFSDCSSVDRRDSFQSGLATTLATSCPPNRAASR